MDPQPDHIIKRILFCFLFGVFLTILKKQAQGNLGNKFKQELQLDMVCLGFGFF